MLPLGGEERRREGIYDSSEMEEGQGEESGMFGLDIETTKKKTPWHCPVCDVSVTNSLAWKQHIHGKKHMRASGYSMRAKPKTEEDILNGETGGWGKGKERGMQGKRVEIVRDVIAFLNIRD